MRRSPFFLVFFSILTVLMTAAAALSFGSAISVDDCARLGLPVLMIETEGGKQVRSKERYIRASYALLDPSGEGDSGQCKIRGRGNTTWKTRELLKKPYLLKLDEERPLLGFPAARKWVLMANAADKTQLRNSYAEHLSSEIWSSLPWTPRSRYISLFLNGKYEGLYALTEKIEAVRGRVPVSEDEGSFVFEVNYRMDKDFSFISGNGAAFSVRTNLGSVTDEEFMRRKDVIQRAEDALFSPKEGGSGGWRDYFDEDSFVDWYLINELTKNHDARFQFSCYLYYDAAAGKIFMGPPWDFDISAGNISWDSCEIPEGFWVRDSLWYERFFEDPDFTAAVKKRWSDSRGELLESLGWIRRAGEALLPAIELDDAVWRSIGRRKWPHAPGWRERKTYGSEIEYMAGWLERRIVWMDGALGGL